MNIRILVIGKIKNDFIKAGVNEYYKRLLPFLSLQIENLQSFSEFPKEVALSKEEEVIKKSIKNSKFLVALDINGINPSSEEFAEKLIKFWEDSGNTEITFLIGGIYGISNTMLKNANFCLSLSKMTFTHDFTLLILLEQIYRGIKILRNEPYHY
ncbi:MAG TPA: 23S rRNA (pseudouridine(1915)-N(3))-methyltransferase RlmH [Dictyoglomaceae bacterium]|nr:23S rRNA (pseudouridine(1915)-N(3))-methyltransferase RlmH [Dictyoglomaceae bacterium]HOL38903.1 23S rRNA (pseudouridine(1915)-N(3))-methyltransferase RlmH [Dictyoglomaceae bacterium]HOP94909.1 23S rRNA (pseudouridine(1915)-N(3))-methyltransferase RlmH [Dictyoglomaceae bacterium]HPP15680.1 23S rRNA (pseudouridine(1915)-N(3))-methyltransferase RlmH [Dictyoglomaceae bacterium]HPU43396.1 23S rRNA (pseudouridine(1915)-N(3))-methyltransferase RlmH [Dictyoglomaceae bacterium]